MMIRFLACAVLLGANGVSHAVDADSTPPTKRETAATLIEDRLQRLADSPGSKTNVAALEGVASEVVKLVPENVLVRQLLENVGAGEEASTTPTETAERQRGKLREVAELLRFERTVEAESPAGFPDPTPVGEIAIKTYPDHRLARTEISDAASDDAAFFRLFAHIKTNAIEMTAPVQMTYGATKDKTPQPLSMAFFYEQQTTGKVGDQGNVKVVDIPSITVVSIGMRGDRTDGRIREARKLLDEWLEKHAGRYKIDGELRVMGHNSPMVPVRERYFEVQIPVRAIRAAHEEAIRPLNVSGCS